MGDASFRDSRMMDQVGTMFRRSHRRRWRRPDGPANLIPKGLRSFDHHDVDSFLDLLPGPRDRDGTPDSIRFSKPRIENCDPDNTLPRGSDVNPGRGHRQDSNKRQIPDSEAVLPVGSQRGGGRRLNGRQLAAGCPSSERRAGQPTGTK